MPSSQQIPQQRTQRNQNQAQNAPKRRPNQGSVNANRQGNQGSQGLPRPKVAPVKPEVVQNSKSGKIEGSGQKEKALEILLPFIGQCLIGAKSEAVSASESINLLVNEGLDPVIVVPQFSGSELITIARDMGVREEEYTGVENWLKGYYDEILSIASSQTRESSAN